MRSGAARVTRAALRALLDGVAAEPDVDAARAARAVRRARRGGERIEPTPPPSPRSLLLRRRGRRRARRQPRAAAGPAPGARAHVALASACRSAPRGAGVGVGGALLEAAAALGGRERRRPRLVLSVFPHNDARDPLLRAAGLRARGPAARAAPSAPDEYHDEVLMARFLTTAALRRWTGVASPLAARHARPRSCSPLLPAVVAFRPGWLHLPASSPPVTRRRRTARRPRPGRPSPCSTWSGSSASPCSSSGPTTGSATTGSLTSASRG